MKTYLLIAMSATALLAGAQPTFADRHDDRGGWHHGRGGPGAEFWNPAFMVERMARRLDLDDAQQQSIGNIIGAARPEIDALRERARAGRQAMRELDPRDPDYSARLNDLALEMGELVTAGTMLFGRVRAEVSQILTPEQQAELEASFEQRARRWRRGPEPSNPE